MIVKKQTKEFYHINFLLSNFGKSKIHVDGVNTFANLIRLVSLRALKDALQALSALRAVPRNEIFATDGMK